MHFTNQVLNASNIYMTAQRGVWFDGWQRNTPTDGSQGGRVKEGGGSLLDSCLLDRFDEALVQLQTPTKLAKILTSSSSSPKSRNRRIIINYSSLLEQSLMKFKCSHMICKVLKIEVAGRIWKSSNCRSDHLGKSLVRLFGRKSRPRS